MKRISPRERNAILRSLGAGVVPAIGLQHIQVGRLEEVEALIKDLELVEEGAATVRFIVGRYGTGKSFFLNLIRTVAQKKKFVVAQADITTERRLQGSGGQAVALFTELMRNLTTQSKPDGNAMPNIIERWIGDIDYEIKQGGGSEEDVKKRIGTKLRPLLDLVSGFDFVTVLTRYYEGFLDQNQHIQDCAIRWLRGEYATKTEARQDLGVRATITDADVYDYLKLYGAFVRIAGYAGMLVNIDELVVLSHRLSNTQARNKNYEAILRIINDCLQGNVEGLAFLFAGTDECLEDKWRGLYSYEALATRLAPNQFADENNPDFASPVIKLQKLRPEEMFVLMVNIRDVQASGKEENHLISNEGIKYFLEDCHSQMGSEFFLDPRKLSKRFVGLLNVVAQNPETNWKSLLKTKLAVDTDIDDILSDAAGDTDRANDDFSEFKL